MTKYTKEQMHEYRRSIREHGPLAIPDFIKSPEEAIEILKSSQFKEAHEEYLKSEEYIKDLLKIMEDAKTTHFMIPYLRLNQDHNVGLKKEVDLYIEREKARGMWGV